MEIKALLAKLLQGETLADEEKSFVEAYDPNAGAGNRIPKERLDQEISKTKAANERAAELQNQLDALKTKVEELETSGMTEAQKAKQQSDKEMSKLKTQIDALIKERNEAQEALSKSQRAAAIAEIAAKNNFRDAGYLDFLTSQKQIDLADSGAVEGLFKELATNNPALFNSTVKPGGGTGAGDGGIGVSGARSSSEARVQELLAKPNLTLKETSEVIALQATLKSQAQNDSGNPAGANA